MPDVPPVAPAALAPALDFDAIDFKLEAPAAASNLDVLRAAGAGSESIALPSEDQQPAQPEVPAAAELESIGTPASAIAGASSVLDRDGIDLDLADAASHDDRSVEPYSAEMSTKLDLAQAYREIGDREGARELLDEVVKSGSQQQAEKAKSMLAELA